MIINQIWLSKKIPDHISAWMRGWEQSGHEYRLWRAADCVQYLPDLRLAEIEMLAPALQSDLLRLLILRDYGGLYADCDIELTGPIPVLPDSMAGIWCGGCDPYLLHVEQSGNAAITAMIGYGFRHPSTVAEIKRWGYHAFHQAWAGVSTDCSGWCTHHSQHSWGKSHQSKPRLIPPKRSHNAQNRT